MLDGKVKFVFDFIFSGKLIEYIFKFESNCIFLSNIKIQKSGEI